ncbi:MAG: rod shape-determining protein MreD [Gammaproteobacteria bacterium]|nr:rod shape-determining protein MreD [Gammaproteobacteria bacterium]
MMIQLRYLVIYLSLVVCLILVILPVPDWVQAYRPNWVALVLIYWSMALPKKVGLWFAFFTGLLVDTLHGTLLGQNALALVVIMFINLNLYQRIRVLSLPQQTLYIYSLLFINQGIISWVEGIMGRPTLLLAFFGAPLIGMLIWPWVFIILRDVRRKAMLG